MLLWPAGFMPLQIARQLFHPSHHGAGLKHLLRQAARLHAEQRRQRRFPDIALILDRDMGVRIRPGQRLDGALMVKTVVAS